MTMAILLIVSSGSANFPPELKMALLGILAIAIAVYIFRQYSN
ncbi:MAG: hypothetical protein WAL80_12610 [Xanthobacteraceae bacterium]